SKSVKVLNKKRNFAQLHLEVGQTNFMLHTCPVCEFMYTPGEDSDEKIHKTFHKHYIHGIPFKGWRNERVVSDCEIGRVVLVQDDDPRFQQNKARDVVRMMEKDLGEGWILSKNCKVYLFISSHRVSGCLVAEPIKRAYRMISNATKPREKTESSATTTELQFGGFSFRREMMTRRNNPEKKGSSDGGGGGGGAVVCDEEGVDAVCGIRAIWVSRGNRRKRVGTHLLDAVRKSFCRDVVLDRCELAFSEPTSDGMSLICSYGVKKGISHVLVYRTTD
ncbi:hypothetical protein M569_06843, partial [Genlisea aurea]